MIIIYESHFSSDNGSTFINLKNNSRGIVLSYKFLFI